MERGGKEREKERERRKEGEVKGVSKGLLETVSESRSRLGSCLGVQTSRRGQVWFLIFGRLDSKEGGKGLVNSGLIGGCDLTIW